METGRIWITSGPVDIYKEHVQVGKCQVCQGQRSELATGFFQHRVTGVLRCFRVQRGQIIPWCNDESRLGMAFQRICGEKKRSFGERHAKQGKIIETFGTGRNPPPVDMGQYAMFFFLGFHCNHLAEYGRIPAHREGEHSCLSLTSYFVVSFNSQTKPPKKLQLWIALKINSPLAIFSLLLQLIVSNIWYLKCA